MAMNLPVLLLGLAALLPAQSWQSLFDGKTLKGWTQCNGKATYRVENGIITGRTAEGSPNSFLCSDKEYGDFILELETKFDPRLNSGIQIRSHRYPTDTAVQTFNGKTVNTAKHPAGRVYGYQVEISHLQSGASGGIYDEARRGWVANIQTDPKSNKAIKENEWNHYKIQAIGDHMRVWVNGVPCADLRDSADLTGFIALQVHSFKGDSPAEVSWRNIRIQDLGKHRWRPLFDGKSMKGWTKVGPGEWKIEDGAFHAKSTPGEQASGFVVHQENFKDATLRVHYKMGKNGDGNSGFFVRSDPKTHAGYEVEIDEKKGSGGLFEVGGRKWVTGPEDNAAVKADDWNELVASVHGDRIVFHLNGVKTLDLPNDTQGRKEGVVALQVHNRRLTEVWFKDVAVLEKAK
jgi:hypothetical protein